MKFVITLISGFRRDVDVFVVFWVITRRRVVIIYHTTPCNYPEDHRLHRHRGGRLKSMLQGLSMK
jgi:hypothetical protein